MNVVYCEGKSGCRLLNVCWWDEDERINWRGWELSEKILMAFEGFWCSFLKIFDVISYQIISTNAVESSNKFSKAIWLPLQKIPSLPVFHSFIRNFCFLPVLGADKQAKTCKDRKICMKEWKLWSFEI